MCELGLCCFQSSTCCEWADAGASGRASDEGFWFTGEYPQDEKIVHHASLLLTLVFDADQINVS